MDNPFHSSPLSPEPDRNDLSRKKGIFLVGPSAPFRGGISHYNTLLFNHLSKQHDVLFCTFKKQYFKFLFPGKGDKDSSSDKIEPEGSDQGKGGSRLKRELHPLNLFSWIKAGRQARNYRLILLPWWVVFWVPYYLLFLAAVNSKKYGNKVLFLCHNVEEHEQRRMGWLKRTLTRSVLKRGDGFILHSRGQERQLTRLLKEKNGPTVVSPHPLYQVFNKNRYTSSAAREKLGIPTDQKTILFFGFIRKYKGLETLLRAMPAVKKYEPRILLLIVGEVWGGKREYNRYTAMIKELGLEENTLFINRYVHNEEVEIYFKACDFVILPYTDGTGSGILQIAYGMGRAVTATRISAFEDVVEEGRTGCLVPPADEQQLADAIINMYESGLLPQMEKEIPEYKRQFEWSMMIDQISRFYTSL